MGVRFLIPESDIFFLDSLRILNFEMNRIYLALCRVSHCQRLITACFLSSVRPISQSHFPISPWQRDKCQVYQKQILRENRNLESNNKVSKNLGEYDKEEDWTEYEKDGENMRHMFVGIALRPAVYDLSTKIAAAINAHRLGWIAKLDIIRTKLRYGTEAK